MKNLITQDPKILAGKPIIAGTRMSVESILELLASDMTVAEILKEYSFLKREHILAAIGYASRLAGKTETTIPITNPPATPHEISRRR